MTSTQLIHAIEEWKDRIELGDKAFTKAKVGFDIEKYRLASYVCTTCGACFDGRVARVAEAMTDHRCKQREVG